jgi:transcriptional regulator with GAF, ATPase, and Fis domain
VLLAKGTTIEEIFLPTTRAKEAVGTNQNLRKKTIDENERDYIISVLKECDGRIWGAGGAAEILNIPPTTLRSKMKKLGIKKEFLQ